MSWELANEKFLDGDPHGALGQFASGLGYSDLIAAAPKSCVALRALLKTGSTENVPAVVAELRLYAEKAPADLAETARTMADLMDGQEFVMVTNGMAPDDDAAEKEDGEPVAKAGNGIMLAFWPSADLAARLAVPGGEDADELHVTLAYFGKLGDADLEIVAEMEKAVERFAAVHGPVDAVIGGVGTFPPSVYSDGKRVVYRKVESGTLQEFRQELVSACEAVGAEPKKNFDYTPHMTVAMVDGAQNLAEFMTRPESVTFDEVVLSIGTAQKRYKLCGIFVPAVAKDDGFELFADIVKLDDDKHVVFGWFSIVKVGDRMVEDTQEDVIKESTIEETAYDFVLNARKGGEMHETDGDGEARGVGRLIESCVFTKEKVEAMADSLHKQGIDAVIDLKCVPWWGGMRIDDPDTWKKVKTGELRAWSLGGRGKRDALGS